MTDQTLLPRSMVLEEFMPYVGKWFLADCDPQPVEIRLTQASPSRVLDASERPPFHLTFFTGPETLLQDGIYALRCESFGPDLVHISSLIAPPQAEAGYYYQAIFN